MRLPPLLVPGFAPAHRMSRRAFLASAGAAGITLAAGCSSGDGSVDASSTSTGDRGELALFQFFDSTAYPPGAPARLPFSVGDRDGLLLPDALPPTLEVTVTDESDQPVGEPVTVERHGDGLARAYYPLSFVPPSAGAYTARSDVQGDTAEMAMLFRPAEEVTSVGPGDEFPAVETPTPQDALGAEPLCTREPPCDLHTSLPAALAEQRPLAVLISTPAFCQTAVCGPVLDLLLEQRDRRPEIGFLHSEVYPRPQESQSSLLPLVQAVGLSFEPSLFLVGADGRVDERLDFIYDRLELGSALDRLAS